MELSKKNCVACGGGLPKLPDIKARELISQIPGWVISGDGCWLLKSYKFADFVKALEFVNTVGRLAEAEGHHPDIAFGWGYVDIKLQTHAIGGLHENDFILAAKIDLPL